jgi:hypothetical protein
VLSWLAVTGCPCGWPADLPVAWLGQGDHSLAGDGLGEAAAVAFGLADVGVVHEPKARGFEQS